MDNFVAEVRGNDKKFYEFWWSLPKKQREDRIRRAYSPIKFVAEEQLKIIKNCKKTSVYNQHHESHFWAFTIIKSFWEDVDFVIGIGKKQKKHYATPIIRILLEKLIRFGYFFKHSIDEQKQIVWKEMLKMSMRFYKEEIANGGNGKKFKDHYNRINDLSNSSFPSIKQITEKQLNPFPESMEVMMYKSGMPESEKWYHHYRFLSEVEHGGLFYQYFREDQWEGEYRRAIMLLLPICCRMLEWTDICLNLRLQIKVQTAIKQSSEIIKKINKQ